MLLVGIIQNVHTGSYEHNWNQAKRSGAAALYDTLNTQKINLTNASSQQKIEAIAYNIEHGESRKDIEKKCREVFNGNRAELDEYIRLHAQNLNDFIISESVALAQRYKKATGLITPCLITLALQTIISTVGTIKLKADTHPLFIGILIASYLATLGSACILHQTYHSVSGQYNKTISAAPKTINDTPINRPSEVSVKQQSTQKK